MTTNFNIDTALTEARNWIDTDDGDDARMTSDIADALAKFDAAVESMDLTGAFDACVSLSQDWASNDLGGFSELAEIIDLVGKSYDHPEGEGTVLDVSFEGVRVAGDDGDKHTIPWAAFDAQFVS